MNLVHKIEALRARPPAEWLNLANDRMPRVMSGLFVVLLAWYLTRLVWALVPQQGAFDWTVMPAPSVMPSRPAANTGGVDFTAIADAHIFGIPGAEPVLQQTVDAPETRLNLKLRGAIAADDPTVAHAIIADGKGNDEVYFIKDKVPGGAVLHEVYADRVILNRAGALETLRLPKLSEALGNQPDSVATRSTAAPAFNGAPPAAAADQASNFTDILRPQPFMPNGEMQGYRVYPGRDRRKFAALGFRPGDLVTTINGQPMDDLQAGMEVFQNFDGTTNLTLTVERGNESVVITIDPSEFAGTGLQ